MLLSDVELTDDQKAAKKAIFNFLLDPVEQAFVLSGYSGCGKTTLVATLLDQLPEFMKTWRLINPNAQEYQITLTATTNKAAENLSRITGTEAITIHQFLGLRVDTDYKTQETTLVPRGHLKQSNYILFIDEASYIDSKLLQFVFQRTHNCKIIFIGDPAQLTPVKSVGTPVFDANFKGAALTEVVRQANGNPIVDLSTKFRHTVNTGEFFSFTPDGHHVQHLNKADFMEAIKKEFTRPDWRYSDSKVLAWTNKAAVAYNQFVNNFVKGDPHFQVGDYAVVNTFIGVGRSVFKTDQLVEITGISGEEEELDVKGNFFTLNGSAKVFMPKSLAEKNARLKRAQKEEDIDSVAHINSTWIDLRAAYACTINKAQGSTHDEVFIDLDDIRRCNSGNQIARMLYVGVSRARNKVYLTGDLA